MKDFKMESKTVPISVNKGSSQGSGLNDGFFAGQRQQRKQKHHSKHVSVGDSKLFPMGGYQDVPKQLHSIPQSLPEKMYQNGVISTNRFDDSHNSILAPNFQG